MMGSRAKTCCRRSMRSPSATGSPKKGSIGPGIPEAGRWPRSRTARGRKTKSWKSAISSGTTSRSPISPASPPPARRAATSAPLISRTPACLRLKDASVLEADIRTGKLPPVAFYKPIGVLNQHPGYANLVPGDEEIGRIVKLMDESPMKDSYAVFITYDENGGLWDHAAPPSGSKAGSRADFFGPGTRVPTIVASPFARKGQVDHTEYDTTSILKLIAERHRLDALPSARFGAVESLAKAFDFEKR